MSLSDILSAILPGDTPGEGWRPGEVSDDTTSAATDSASTSDSPLAPTDDEMTVIYECRECGTTVTADTTCCPTCRSTAIAEYPVE